MRIVTSTRGRPSSRERQDLEGVDAVRGVIPFRPRADESEGLRDLLAAGAHRGAAPEIEHDAARPFAAVLRITRDDVLGGAAADFPGVAGRHGARVDREQVASRRQHVEPPARRRARRPRAARSGRRARRAGRAFPQGRMRPRPHPAPLPRAGEGDSRQTHAGRRRSAYPSTRKAMRRVFAARCRARRRSLRIPSEDLPRRRVRE